MHRSEAGPSQDASVRSTDTDALVSRASAAALGYLEDPFAPLFLSPSQKRSLEKRPPLINIGTHARTWAIDALVQQFLDNGEGQGSVKGKERQVLSLGAGTDTRFWRMKAMTLNQEKKWLCRRWVEVDFEETTASKARAISSKAALKDGLGGSVKIEFGGTGLSSTSYALVPGDLRNFATLAERLLKPLPSDPSGSPLLDPSIPTLLLAECVFIYLPPETSAQILSWFTKSFASGSSVSYDPFGLHDNFGKVMIRNLATRNLSLPAAESTPTLESLSARLSSAGYESAASFTIRQIRDTVVPLDESTRVSHIEMIDEVEELNLVLEHYAISLGSFGGSSISLPSR
ncbi:leucine carboxyl methyltransferase [Meredithblackwellia eburnea MCA 4105]